MPTHKFKAGETQGTYVLTEPVTTEEILAMANRLARARVAKGKALTSPSLTYSCLQTLLQGYEREVFAIAYSHAWRSLNNIHADHVITSMPITQ